MAKTVSAFGGATAKKATKPSAPSGPIIVCDDLKSPDGETIYTREEMIQAVQNYNQGADLADRADGLMKKSKKPILDFVRAKFALVWATLGSRPQHSPKLVTNDSGDGDMLTVEFQNRECALNDEQFADFAAVVGEENAQSVVTKGWEWSLNPDTLETEVPELPELPVYDEDGNLVYFNEKTPENVVSVEEGQKPPKGFKQQTRKQTFFDLVDAALSEKFVKVFGAEKAGEKIGGLLLKKEIFKTNKGMIDKLLDFVGRCKPEDAEGIAASAAKLDKAILTGNVRNSVKPGILRAKKKDGAEDD